EYKDRPVVTYCTGGIRCEVLSVLMKNRGFNEVYQLDGGIVRYGETYGNSGLWDGSLYVFDKRMHMDRRRR
ncbi:rhodanese-like domain-containing protein, partial [Brevibacterium paucivorans]|uniref:rhodanese-like domain-containing protein n=1 Tax=Brevibacterium paucivorans TaxID=170994 RepID=UPI00215584DF